MKTKRRIFRLNKDEGWGEVYRRAEKELKEELGEDIELIFTQDQCMRMLIVEYYFKDNLENRNN